MGLEAIKTDVTTLSPPGNLSLGSSIIALLDQSHVILCCDVDPEPGALVLLEL